MFTLHSWFREQHYSLSGFIHITTILSFDELTNHTKIAEWLETFQYAIKMCRSQNEEMPLIGALCYGSLFLYREYLLLHILKDPLWIEANQTRHKPIIIDMVVKPFRGSSKSIEMIFVRAERSKKDIAKDIMEKIYDGSIKSYPRRDMLFFIPISSKIEDDYTPQQGDKFIFNHENYLGEEDCMALFGLNDFNSNITLKNGTTTSI